MAVDFQFTGLGIAVMDIVYFLDSSCPLRNYQDVEDILKAYHDTLVENGVCGYSWDTLIREFEAFVVSRLLTGPLFMGYEPEPFIELITTLIGAEKSVSRSFFSFSSLLAFSWLRALNLAACFTS